ncbi:MAG: hypothetical protein B6242_14520 [Anaerolineaceae bacterium 4572_78]|nr:MAG: hypothetical protein B6242_14520 [Anaerolineaceae bacterium 4572_78]
MTNNRYLNSLYIENFRAFKRLEIKQLGQINLITGKNNVGKTCLLETIWLYASDGDPHVIQEILKNRGELENGIKSVKHFFHADSCLSKFETIDQKQGFYMGIDNIITSLIIANVPLSISKDGKINHPPPPDKINEIVYRKNLFRIARNDLTGTTTHQFVSSKGISHEKIVNLWKEVDFTDLEDDIKHALQVIEPNVRTVGLDVKTLAPTVRVGNKRWIISSLGGGMNRTFEMALALVNAKDGFLMIDEIENGLFYEVQPMIWNFIFEVAKRLNVQVFVTTHGKDAIEAFDEANREHEDVKGMMISLRHVNNKPGEVVGITFDTEEIEYMVDTDLEVR